MNITLNGIKITQDSKTLAFEKNNNVDEIVITVDTDESWSYKLDVKYPDKFNIGKDALYNIIDLNRNGIICSVALTREMLPFNGKYTMQLRGINGDKVYHSDTFEVWVKYSIEPGSTYNPVPSEFYQVEARLDNKVDEAKQYAENAEIASTRMPKISPDNTWLIWDAETGDYVDTGIVASGGTTDHSKLINRSAADQHPMSAITGLEKALESKQPAGAYLTDKDLDTTLKETGKAADASEVGKRLSSLSEEIGNLPSGVSSNAKTLLITILRNGVYSSDQSENIAALKTALESGVSDDSGESGGGDSGDSGETSVYVYSLEKGNAILIDGGASGVYNGTVGVNITQATRVTLLAKTGDADLWCVTSRSPFSKLDTECYPIPVPADATGVNISVSDGNVLGPAFYTYDGTTFTRTLDSGWQTSGAYSLTFEPGTYQYLSVNTKLATGISYTDVDKPTSYVVEFTK